MSATVLLSFIIGYFVLLLIISYFTSRNADDNSFFIGNKKSPWYLVAFGMIGVSLSGVTFMSVPGYVGTSQFSYMLIVLGYLVGYFIIATVLLPMYYRLNLTSIYTYLDQRFGKSSYLAGASFFLLSRTIGASFRMFLVINVLQVFVLETWGIPFWVSVLVFIISIILYTYEGGIKTIIWTDTLQTTFMLAGVIISVILVSKELGLSFTDLIKKVSDSEYSKMFYTDWHDKRFYLKQFLSGIFIAIVMTGLDQEMMQKNLSCKNLKEAQKNIFTFSFIMVLVNFLFLFLGAVLYLYATKKGIAIPERTDNLFPMIAFNYLGAIASLVFMIGIVSAAFPSADGALTALTTSVCVDFLGFNSFSTLSKEQKKRWRYIIHFSFAALLFIVILIFKAVNNEAVISAIFTAAGYTYGPLLGLYSFGLFTKYSVKDKWVPAVAIASPIICYILNVYSEILFNGYVFGFELLILNGLITFSGLFLLRKKQI